MIRKRADHGIIILTAFFFIAFAVLAFNYYRISAEQQYVRTAQVSSKLVMTVGECQGTVYDRNMKPLVNAETVLAAAAIPEALDREATAAYAADKEQFYKDFDAGEPFVFTCTEKADESDGLTVFELPVRYSGSQLARHVIGYLSDDSGADGIEYAYDSILRSGYSSNSVTYSIDGFGNILLGDGKEVFRTSSYKTGVVLTIDKDIQEICERSGKSIKKGAIVCADIKTGDILAMASFPSYDPEELERALNDSRSPLINRALYSYSVGSVFKLVTAATALEDGFEGQMYNCTGSIDISGRTFNCHKLDGHELQNMTDAMINSCNTYFIDLSRCLDTEKLRKTASDIGFGRENYLCAGMTGSGGVLPTADELAVPAELANFSFGQGRLTATPLQITQLTCAIANDGNMPILRLVKGITADGSSAANEKSPQLSRVMSEETAEKLRRMMILAVRDNDSSNAKTKITKTGAKTSTAQTGKFSRSGEELCHAWITGFFPSRKPKYAVTVLIENGGYGNDAAAPVFSEIADSIAKLNKNSENG